jgi:predicted Rossmann fold nucleotide-binding protein DprA/Smf involved in DNA uptake
VLFIKGNKQLLQEKSIAIVGSRKAEDSSLRFTDDVAKKCSKEFKVVVSGFAKGIDKQALDSTLAVKGQSIIVLPQGINTFSSGMKQYYRQINQGDVLILSTFHPRSPWSVKLAMARNSIIYGLAKEIYVAQSDNKGGTWSGVLAGLSKGRTIYVRNPNVGEKNANNLLIEKGAKPVDMNGNLIIESELTSLVSEPMTEGDNIENRIIKLLKEGFYSTKEIISKLNLSITEAKLRSQLRKRDDIEEIKGRPIKFKINNAKNEPTLF